MRRRVRIRIAGTIAAIPLCAIPATATSQNAVLNDQVQLGDVFAGQTLNVVSQSQASVSAVAAGNAVSGATASGDLPFASAQTMSGATGAEGDLSVSQFAGQGNVLSAAIGNQADGEISGGGTLAGQSVQVTNGPSVSANAALLAPNAQVASASFDDQAIGNSQTFAVSGSALSGTVSQLDQASVTTVARTKIGYLPGTGTFLSTAIGDAVATSGAGAANQSLGVGQFTEAPIIQAANVAKFGDAQSLFALSTAAANNAALVNAGGPLAAAVSQTAQAPVVADTRSIADEFGQATVQAQAVGNAVVAGNVGGGIALNINQNNAQDGEQATASFTGGSGGVGYDAAAAAIAVGNSASGFTCSQCGGVMEIGNSQTNGGAVASQSNVSLTAGATRSASASSLAIGNAASFVIGSPGS